MKDYLLKGGKITVEDRTCCFIGHRTINKTEELKSKLYEVIGSGKAAYIERNCEMVNNSHFCIVYYDEQTAPTTRKSGTKIALDYAVKQGNRILNLL